MSGALEVLEGGLQTTVQDFGRPGLLALGVPVSGALDTISFRLANLIVGNAEGAAALECRSPGPALRVTAGGVRIALAGTSAPLLIERGGTVEEWPSWRAIDLLENDIVRVAPFADSAIAYLAFSGGIDVPEVFGSRSTFLRGGFGGLDGHALATGDVVPLGKAKTGMPCLTLLQPPFFPPAAILRAVPGPQADHFTPTALTTLFAHPFTVTRDLDRMGVRLEGSPLPHGGSADIVSDATAPGTLQVPGSQQPILLLADCQTTGGYPKIATIISADLPAAGRLTAGAEVRFKSVTVEDAEEANAVATHAFQRIAALLVPLREAVRL